MSFLRHREIYRNDDISPKIDRREQLESYSLAHRIDEFPVGYSLAGCSPAEPASA